MPTGSGSGPELVPALDLKVQAASVYTLEVLSLLIGTTRDTTMIMSTHNGGNPRGTTLQAC